MALQIEEFREAGRGAAVPLYPPLAIQSVAIGASSTASSAFNASARFVRLLASAECYFKVGADPTAAADATSSRLPADTVVDIGIQGAHKIAVIQA